MSARFRHLAVFAVSALVVLLATALGLYVPFANAYVTTHPARNLPGCAPPAGARDAQFASSGGLILRGWYVPPENGAVVIFVHGAGANRCALLNEAAFITQAGYGALLFDLRNHGLSDGQVTSMGPAEAQDVLAAVAYVHQTTGEPARIALFGHSLGAGAVLLAAPDAPDVSAVIAESGFARLDETLLPGATDTWFAPLFFFFGERLTGVDFREVRPLAAVADISPASVLFIHGEADPNVPVGNALRLYTAAREPKELYLLAGVGHAGFLQAQPAEYPRRILDFLEKALFGAAYKRN